MLKRRRPAGPSLNNSVKSASRSLIKTILLAIFSILFALGGIFFGFIFLVTVGGIFVRVPSATIPFINLTVKPPPQTSIGAPPEPELPTWEGQDRVTILLLGIDQRSDEVGQPTRSDTMILLTINPANDTAGMLSIPRDLWVPIPGYSSNKINTAHFLGESQKKGEGPATVRKTIEYNFGVKVDYYARVDFHGFEKLIDTIGGITVDVRRPIKDDEYPNENYGIIRVYVPAGVQHMDGISALRFARSRHSESDFGRMRRQQQVLLAARNEALNLNIIPKIPQLIGIVRGAVATDISPTDMIALASLARRIDLDHIVSRTIDSTMVIDVNRDGTVLVPDREKIRKVMQEVFNDAPVATPTAVATATPSAVAKVSPTAEGKSNRKVRVLNGTTRNLFAATTAEALEQHGYEAIEVAQAVRNDYAKTIIMVHGPRRTEAEDIAKLLGVPSSAIRTNQPAAGNADITIILGFDAAAP